MIRSNKVETIIGEKMDLSTQSDKQLMAAVNRGSEQAFALLFDRYAAAVMGLVLKIVGSRELAEEIVQETFYRLWDKSDTYQADRGSVSAWLLRVARNLAFDALRRRQVRPYAPEDDRQLEALYRQVDGETNVAEAAWLSMKVQEVQSALQQLPPEQVEVIELAYFRGLTRREIAAETGLALGTVHTRARLALQKLRALLDTSEINE